jgi:NAD(P)-dependent dehydrogenase (short-subunit alcohol dehydrogenase family)
VSDTVLIYGGSGGIGSALALRLAQQGVRSHLVGRDVERLKARASGCDAGFTAGDVTDATLFARVAGDAGNTLAGLVYAVGTINLRSVARLTADDYRRDFEINAMGAALAVQAALPALKRHAGVASIVLFSSIAAQQGFPLHASIGMAKAAVAGLTVSLAAELAPHIRVNALAPSLLRTPLAAGLLANEQTAATIAAQHPLPRLGEAADAAALAAFLVSPEAGWITGQILAVDGGRSTLRSKG